MARSKAAHAGAAPRPTGEGNRAAHGLHECGMVGADVRPNWSKRQR